MDWIKNNKSKRYSCYIERDEQTLKIQVYYSLGGMNYFTYKQDGRGFYLNVTPVKLEKRQGYTMESFTMFSGIKKFLLPCTRYSEKRLEEALKLSDEWIDKLICHVLDKQQKEKLATI